jgi:ABC-type transport system involved in cytochrome c biogenesis ATPase subunit
LQLAINTLNSLIKEDQNTWAEDLSDLSRTMLKSMDTDFESVEFGTNLDFRVRLKGGNGALSQADIRDRLSAGARDQVYLLARMAVMRFVSLRQELPIIFDESFSEMDDERYLKLIRFLLHATLKQGQILLLSCHKKRHEWLMTELNGEESSAIHWCKLAPLKCDTQAVTHR